MINLLPTHNDILSIRRYLGLTQAEAADGSGLSLATLGRMERGLDAQYSSWVKLFKFYHGYKLPKEFNTNELSKDRIIEFKTDKDDVWNEDNVENGSHPEVTIEVEPNDTGIYNINYKLSEGKDQVVRIKIKDKK